MSTVRFPNPKKALAFILFLMYLLYALYLMPHLIRGLDLPSCEIRSNIIDTLTVVASSDGIHGPTQEHATTLASIVLKNALPQEITSVVRIYLNP